MIHTILVPLDGSASSERALPVSGELARALDARLALVCVAGAGSALQQKMTPEDRQAVSEQYAGVKEEEHLLSTTPGMVERAQHQVRAVAEAERYLAAVATRLVEAGLQVETGVPYGDPVEGILTEIGLHSASLVVMAAHRRQGLSRLAGGSVALAVFARSPVPVLLVPPER